MILVLNLIAMKDLTDSQVLESFQNTFKFNKMLTFAKDVQFTDEKQFSVVNLIQILKQGILVSILF